MEMRATRTELQYQSGFGNYFAAEAVAGALPIGRNSPQRAPHGLYAEVLSGSAFTAPRAENHSTLLYKLRPSAMHGPYRRIADGELRSGPFDEVLVGAQPLLRQVARQPRQGRRIVVWDSPQLSGGPSTDSHASIVGSVGVGP
jgi:homogentisate 1,2-dioxygenase